MLMEWKTIQIGWVLMKKYWKRGFREDVRGLKQVSHKKKKKKTLKSHFWAFRDWASRKVQSRKFSRVASEWRASCESRVSVAKIFASREKVASESPKLLDELVTSESPVESRKTLTPVFQHRTCLHNEKQNKH